VSPTAGNPTPVAKRILVVDDDDKVRRALVAYLAERGAVVEQARNGLEALERIRERPPDLLITDVRMPGVDGLELTRRLRQQHRTARLPILMLSNKRDTEDVLNGYGAGADDYVEKFVDLAVLGAKVDTLLRRPQEYGQPPASNLGRVVAFAHAKGGVGTTTLLVNAAAWMSSNELLRTAIFDLNVGFGTATTLLDVQPGRTLAQFAGEETLDDEALTSLLVRHASGVVVLPTAISPEDGELLTLPMIQRALEFLRSQADFVLVDTPVGFTEAVLSVFDVADLVCLVTAPHLPALKATASWQTTFTRLAVADLRLSIVLNRTTPQGLDHRQVEKFLGRKPVIVVPYSDPFDVLSDMGGLLVLRTPEHSGALATRDLARLMVQDVKTAVG